MLDTVNSYGFVPRVITLPVPNPQQPMQAAPEPRRELARVPVPWSVTADMTQIAGAATPVVGETYERDYFIGHGIDAKLEELRISGSVPSFPTPVRVELIEKVGIEKTTSYGSSGSITAAPRDGISVAITQSTDAGALFLRVTANYVAVDYSVFATLIVLTPEVF